MMAKSDHSDREKAERIDRLKKRLEQVYVTPDNAQLVGVFKGLLDLLADEL